jgi:hypothetical protein
MVLHSQGRSSRRLYYNGVSAAILATSLIVVGPAIAAGAATPTPTPPTDTTPSFTKSWDATSSVPASGTVMASADCVQGTGSFSANTVNSSKNADGTYNKEIAKLAIDTATNVKDSAAMPDGTAVPLQGAFSIGPGDDLDLYILVTVNGTDQLAWKGTISCPLPDPTGTIYKPDVKGTTPDASGKMTVSITGKATVNNADPSDDVAVTVNTIGPAACPRVDDSKNTIDLDDNGQGSYKATTVATLGSTAQSCAYKMNLLVNGTPIASSEAGTFMVPAKAAAVSPKVATPAPTTKPVVTPTPTPTPTVTRTPTPTPVATPEPTPTNKAAAVTSTSNTSGTSTGGFDPLWLIPIAVLVVLITLAVVVLIRLFRGNGRGSEKPQRSEELSYDDQVKVGERFAADFEPGSLLD